MGYAAHRHWQLDRGASFDVSLARPCFLGPSLACLASGIWHSLETRPDCNGSANLLESLRVSCFVSALDRLIQELWAAPRAGRCMDITGLPYKRFILGDCTMTNIPCLERLALEGKAY